MVLLLTLDQLWCSSEPVQLWFPQNTRTGSVKSPQAQGSARRGGSQCQGEDNPSLAMRRAQLPIQHQSWPLQSVFLSAEVGSGSSSGAGFCWVDSLKEKSPWMAFSSPLTRIFNDCFQAAETLLSKRLVGKKKSYLLCNTHSGEKNQFLQETQCLLPPVRIQLVLFSFSLLLAVSYLASTFSEGSCLQSLSSTFLFLSPATSWSAFQACEQPVPCETSVRHREITSSFPELMLSPSQWQYSFTAHISFQRKKSSVPQTGL